MSRQDNKRYVFKEYALYDVIQKSLKEQNNLDISPDGEYKAFVIQYSREGSGLIEEKDSNGNVLIQYPQHYVRAWIPGLDNGLPSKYCRVFKPSQTSQKADNLNQGDMILVKFEDIYMTQGRWIGKIENTKPNTSGPLGISYEQEDNLFKYGFYDEKNSQANSYIEIEKVQQNEVESDTIKLNWPIYPGDPGSSPKKIPNGGQFGSARPGHYHKGIDISTQGCPRNSDDKQVRVIPAYNGEVERLGFDDNIDSNFIVLIHSVPRQYVVDNLTYNSTFKFRTKYIHLQNIQVRTGQPVYSRGSASTILGYIAEKDSVSTAAHLHFEVHRISDDAAINPLNNNLAVLNVFSG